MARDFDSFFEELVRERIDELQCPPKEEAWDQLKRQLRKERKKERRKYLLKQLRPVCAACMLIAFLIAIYIIPGTNVMAFTSKIIKCIILIKDDTIKIYEKLINGNDIETGHFFGREIDDPRIGEAQKEVHFRLYIPEYIPEDFKLESVDVLNKYEGKETVAFLYLNTNNGKKESFEIMQWSYPNDTDIALNYTKDENTKIEKLFIEGIEYTLVSYEKKLNGLLWNCGNIGCEISGNITRDDILKVAKSMN